MFILFITLLVNCSHKTVRNFDKKLITRPIKSAKSKGIITLFNGNGAEFIYFKMFKDREKAFLRLESQFGLNIANIYKRHDSLWIVIPMKKVVYFQDKSNILLLPNIGDEGMSFGMLFDLMVANFSLSYSIPYMDSDEMLVNALQKDVRYSFMDGKLADISYGYGNYIYTSAVHYNGTKIKINLKKNSDLKISINITDLTLQSSIDNSFLTPKIPIGYQKVDL